MLTTIAQQHRLQRLQRLQRPLQSRLQRLQQHRLQQVINEIKTRSQSSSSSEGNTKHRGQRIGTLNGAEHQQQRGETVGTALGYDFGLLRLQPPAAEERILRCTASGHTKHTSYKVE